MVVWMKLGNLYGGTIHSVHFMLQYYHDSLCWGVLYLYFRAFTEIQFLTMVQACFLLIMVWAISWNLNVSHGC